MALLQFLVFVLVSYKITIQNDWCGLPVASEPFIYDSISQLLIFSNLLNFCNFLFDG